MIDTELSTIIYSTYALFKYLPCNWNQFTDIVKQVFMYIYKCDG